MSRCRGAVRLRAGPVARTLGALDTIVAFGNFGIRSGEIPPFVFWGARFLRATRGNTPSGLTNAVLARYFTTGSFSESRTLHPKGSWETRRRVSSIPCIVLLPLIFTALSFGRDDTAGSLVPALSSQPFFQRLEMDFRVIAPQLRDVRPETIGVEPVEHLIEFLAENQPDHRHWQLPEPDRFSD